jgi:hypothetical protein
VKTRATTTVSIKRATTTTVEGDEVDTAATVATGVTASIIEQSRRIFDSNDSSTRVVRLITARLPHGTDVRDEDRLYDEQNDVTYMVSSVTRKQHPSRRPDLELDLVWPT